MRSAAWSSRSRTPGSPPAEVAHVNAHGTSTPLNDLAEAEAIEKIFGRPGPPVTSIKGVTGHSLGAAGRDRGRRLRARRSSGGSSPRRSGWSNRTPRSTSTSSGTPHGSGSRDRSCRTASVSAGTTDASCSPPRPPEHTEPRGVVDLGESRRRADQRPADCAFAGFSDDPPWLIDPRRPALARRHRRHPGEDASRGTPASSAPAAIAAGAPHREVAWTLGQRGRGLVPRRSRRGPATVTRSGLSRRLRIAFGKLGPTYIKLGQILSSGEGIFPEEIVSQFRLLRDRVPPESFDDVRRIVEAELRGPLEGTFAEFDRTPIAAASIAQVHGARLAHRRAGRRQGAAARRRRARAKGPRRHELLRPVSRRADPGRRARQPAGAHRAVRRDDRRGARLPPRGRQHARRRPRPRRNRPALHHRPPPASTARHPPDARDGAARRLRMGRRRGDAGGRDRHRGRAAGPRWSPSSRAPCCTGSSTATCTVATSSSRATAASPCSTSASPAGSASSSAWRFCSCSSAGRRTTSPSRCRP